MTDNEIAKALECCVNADCEKCPSKTICDSDTERLVVKVSDLVDRQKAEIERLDADLQKALSLIRKYEDAIDKQIEACHQCNAKKIVEEKEND
jgi:hypothetical protein